MPAGEPFPVFLNLSGRRVVVVGGGPVGRRKAAACRDAGAAVRVIALHPPPADFPLDGVSWHTEPYRRDHLQGAALVFAAASALVNAGVVADAAAAGVWVCDAADPGRGTFTLPAVARAGRVVAAVGTGGASPGLSRRLAADWAAGWDEAFVQWVDLLAEARTEVLQSIADPAKRRAVLSELAGDGWRERVRRDGAEAARAAMGEEIRRRLA